MPFVYVAGVQDAQPDVPALVDRAVAVGRRRDDRRRERQRRAGREVVRRRAGPGRRAGRRRAAAASGRRCGRSTSGLATRRSWRTCPGSASPPCCSTAGGSRSTAQVTVGAIVAFNAYVVMLQAPFRILGMIMMLGQRAAASAGRIYEILDEPADIVDRPGAVDLVSTPRRRRASRRDVRLQAYRRRDRRAGALALRPARVARARPSRSSGAPAAASRPSPGCSPASTTSTAARC